MFHVKKCKGTNRILHVYYDQQIQRELKGIHICGCQVQSRLKAKMMDIRAKLVYYAPSTSGIFFFPSRWQPWHIQRQLGCTLAGGQLRKCYRTGPATLCISCEAGKYSEIGIADPCVCVACGAGKYGNATGQTAETSCTAWGAKKGVEDPKEESRSTKMDHKVNNKVTMPRISF